jgi:ribA/ribD-fused uncharacterized protein
MKITDFSGMKEKNEIIEEFKGEYRWLSNFMPVTIILDGITYPSVEHAYVSAKGYTKEWKMECADTTLTSANAKAKGRGLTVEDKDEIMTECVKQKFNQEPYKTKLLATGDRHIQEGNRWGDKYWGVCLKTNIGENKLGNIIMKIRDDLRAS